MAEQRRSSKNWWWCQSTEKCHWRWLNYYIIVLRGTQSSKRDIICCHVLKNRAPDSNASFSTSLPSRDWMVARKGEHFAFVSFVCFLMSSHCSSILSNSMLKCNCPDCRFHLLLRLPSLLHRVGKLRVTLRSNFPGGNNNIHMCFLLIECTIMRSAHCFSFHTLTISVHFWEH